jgi:hypothetical protein
MKSQSKNGNLKNKRMHHFNKSVLFFIILVTGLLSCAEEEVKGNLTVDINGVSTLADSLQSASLSNDTTRLVAFLPGNQKLTLLTESNAPQTFNLGADPIATGKIELVTPSVTYSSDSTYSSGTLNIEIVNSSVVEGTFNAILYSSNDSIVLSNGKFSFLRNN